MNWKFGCLDCYFIIVESFKAKILFIKKNIGSYDSPILVSHKPLKQIENNFD